MPVQAMRVSKGAKRAVRVWRGAVAMLARRMEMGMEGEWSGDRRVGLVEEGRRRRVILVLLGSREGWVVRAWRTEVPSSPTPRMRIEEGVGIVAVGWVGGWVLLVGG